MKVSEFMKPWELSEQQRTDEIAKLKQDHREALATPLMSEGAISGYQLGRMSKRQREKHARLADERLCIEYVIRDLKNPEPLRIADERRQLENAKSDIKHQRERIETLKRLGMGKRGKVKPTWQKAIDECLSKIQQHLAKYPSLNL